MVCSSNPACRVLFIGILFLQEQDYLFLSEIIYLRATDIAQYDAFWHEAPALRPITNRTKMIIAGTSFSSPPDCLLAWNEQQKKKMISQAAEGSNATEAEAEV
jgi:hypothetical protein